jgi:hypothetical protein
MSRFFLIKLSEDGLPPIAMAPFSDSKRVKAEESHNHSAGGEYQEIEEKEDYLGLHRAEDAAEPFPSRPYFGEYDFHRSKLCI